MDLLTVGYEGLTLDQFFALLASENVEIIVDVRQNPISRKKGFSKNALSSSASEHGLTYVHLKEFGCPLAIRNEYRETSDWSEYTLRYTDYLSTLNMELYELLSKTLAARCCLLCFEADPETCHRYFIAERLKEIATNHFAIVHLRV